jgi:hypothetical protein
MKENSTSKRRFTIRLRDKAKLKAVKPPVLYVVEYFGLDN